MDKDQQIAALQREKDALLLENARLRAQIQQNTMEQAIWDDQRSQSIRENMAQFYDEPLAPWYIFILFFGSRPSQQPQAFGALPPTSPLEQVERRFLPPLRSFGQPFFFQVSGTIACLLNVALPDAPEESPEAGKAYCGKLRDALQQTYDTDHTQVSHISVSHASLLPQGPRALYRSAVSVAEQRRRDSPKVLMEEAHISPSRQDLTQIFSLEPLFWRKIQQHAFFDAAGTLDSIIELTILDQGSLERASAALFSRMEMVLQTTLSEKGLDPMGTDECSHLLPAICHAETYQQLREVCYDLLATLEDRFYTPPDSRNRKMASIESYIQAHYRDPMLCAASIADAFKISPSYLSRIFKADMGVGIVEYVHRIRVDAAKELLMDPQLTMDIVAQRAGFSNRWVLTRVFKKTVGMTPGAYRDDSRPMT